MAVLLHKIKGANHNTYYSAFFASFLATPPSVRKLLSYYSTADTGMTWNTSVKGPLKFGMVKFVKVICCCSCLYYTYSKARYCNIIQGGIALHSLRTPFLLVSTW